MSRIRILPERVANQIAAGEVVDRPVSVVKELVENAIDAGAGRIDIEIQAGGRGMIRVADDGHGMSRDEALLALERHATSKIQEAEDLGGIATLGFRGEALPSIASVSRFTLTTCEDAHGAVAGAQVVIRGGTILEVKEAGRRAGTTVEVRELFYNVPARRKFLRSQETEKAHILHYLTLVALACPQITWTLTIDRRLHWHLPTLAHTDRLAALKDRWRHLPGRDEDLMTVDHAGELPGFTDRESEVGYSKAPIRVWGLIGPPGVGRSNRQDQYFFVNRRPVENRGLSHAVAEAYHTALPKGRHPIACLFLDMDPSEVDVNVHPSKKEVKFHREQALRRLMTEAVGRTLFSGEAGQDPSTGPGGEEVPEPPPIPEPQPLPEPAEQLPLGGSPNPTGDAYARAAGQQAAGPGPAGGAPETDRAGIPKPGEEGTPASAAPQDEPTESGTEPSARFSGDSIASGEVGRSDGRDGVPEERGDDSPGAVPLRVVGRLANGDAVLESDRGMVLLDPRAAHERVLFERTLAQLRSDEVPSQRLLLPETIELAPRDAQFVRRQLSIFQRMGIGLSEFGESTFLLDALPPFVDPSQPKQFILETIDELKGSQGRGSPWRVGEEAVAQAVCHRAVQAGATLHQAELERLLGDLRQCAMPYTSPTGRPTLVEIAFRELDRKLGRL